MALAIKQGLKPRWLSICGTTGTGKSHCARRIWQFGRANLNWSGCDYISNTHGKYWPSEVDALRAGNHFEHFNDMKRWPILFLDDIGAERDNTGFATEKLNTLLGCRDERWTIITSNLMLEQLAAIEPRIADRIIRQPNIFIEITTKSHALR